jgi:hypothetical protein
MVAVANHPAIHPGHCILPIPSSGKIGCLEDDLPSAVVNSNAELPGFRGGSGWRFLPQPTPSHTIKKMARQFERSEKSFGSGKCPEEIAPSSG